MKIVFWNVRGMNDKVLQILLLPGEFGVRHARIGSLASSSFSLIHNPNGNREHAFQHSLSSGLEKDLSAEGQSSLCSDKASRPDRRASTVVHPTEYHW